MRLVASMSTAARAAGLPLSTDSYTEAFLPRPLFATPLVDLLVEMDEAVSALTPRVLDLDRSLESISMSSVLCCLAEDSRRLVDCPACICWWGSLPLDFAGPAHRV
jgi:hypothetical protein